MPIIVAVLAWLTGGSNRLTVTRWAGLLAGLTGVALLAGARCRRSAGWPITEVLLVAVCYAIEPLIASRKADRAPARRHDRCMPGIRCRRLFTAGSADLDERGIVVLSGERVWMRRSLIEPIRPRPQPARLVFPARMKTLGPAS